MSKDEIRRQINSIKDSRKKNTIIKRMRTESNIKKNYEGMKSKK
jgi:hypothetical protein